MGFINFSFNCIDGKTQADRAHIRALFGYAGTRSGTELLDTSGLYRSPGVMEKVMRKALAFTPELYDSPEYLSYRLLPDVQNALSVLHKARSVAGPERFPMPAGCMLPVKSYPFGHGLFSDDYVPVRIEELKTRLLSYTGRVYHVILSTDRADAERYGLFSGRQWMDLLRSRVPLISRTFNIPASDMRWYAAFHNRDTGADRPHVHLLVLSLGDTGGSLLPSGRDLFVKELERAARESAPRNRYVPESRADCISRRRNILREARDIYTKAGSEPFEPSERLLRLLSGIPDACRINDERDNSILLRKQSSAKILELLHEIGKTPAVSRMEELWERWQRESNTGTMCRHVPHAPFYIRRDLSRVRLWYQRYIWDYGKTFPTEDEETMKLISTDLYRGVIRQMCKTFCNFPENDAYQVKYVPKNPAREEKVSVDRWLEDAVSDPGEEDLTKMEQLFLPGHTL